MITDEKSRIIGEFIAIIDFANTKGLFKRDHYLQERVDDSLKAWDCFLKSHYAPKVELEDEKVFTGETPMKRMGA